MKKSQAFEAALVIGLICLAGLLYFMIVSSSQSASGWEKQANGSVDYMLVGGDDTLYTFSDNNVSAFSRDGDLRWRLGIPKEWKVLNSWDMPVYSEQDNGGGGKMFLSYPIVKENNGSLYLLAVYALNWTDIDTAHNISEKSIGDYHYLSPVVPYISKPAKVMEISPGGSVVWEYSFTINLSTWDIGGLVRPEYYMMEKPIAISVYGGRVYVYHDYTVDVLDADGNRLFSIPDASSPAAVDENGRIYIVQAVYPSSEQFNLSLAGNYSKNISVSVGWDGAMIAQDVNYMLTGSTVEAYNPDGSLLWSMDIGANATRPFIEKEAWPYYNTLPLYSDGRLYVPIEDGIVMLDMDGRINKTIHMDDGVYTLFPLMPLDSQGNVYMVKLDPHLSKSYITVISPEGRISQSRDLYDYYAYYDNGRLDLVPAGAYDGIIYAYKNSQEGNNIGIGVFEAALVSKHFDSDTVYAYDAVNGSEVWAFTIPAGDVHVVTLNADNVGKAIQGTPYQPPLYSPGDAATVPLFPYSQGTVKAYHGRNMTYLDYYYSMYETPFIPNRSRCVYARGLYALDNNGKLLWEKDPDGFVSNVAVGNSTIYYSTDNGRIGGTTLNIAAGAILATFTYLFLRFFAAGSVTRARSRIDKNEKRNEVQKFIADNPGSTLRDIARGTGVNLGTVRYHVFILGLNHRIVSYAADDKHVRYFTNSGAYSKEEQLIISLMRREGLRKIMELLVEKPGMTNLELSSRLGIHESAVSRYMKELAERGIVDREGQPGGYFVKSEYSQALRGAARRMDNSTG